MCDKYIFSKKVFLYTLKILNTYLTFLENKIIKNNIIQKNQITNTKLHFKQIILKFF